METYLDFDLVLERSNDADSTTRPTGEPSLGYPRATAPAAPVTTAIYSARVTGSPAGKAESEFELPFQPLEVENFALKLGHRRGMRRIESSNSAEARSFGQRLFDAVFTGDVALAYGRSLDEARRTGSGLRVRLRLEDQQLASIPWEFLHHAAKDDFLVLSKQTPLVRVLDVPRQLRSNTIELPLRVLVMVSSPSDQANLDVEAEYDRLASAMQDRIASGHIHMVRVGGSMSELQRALRKDTYHVFHFIGHGGYDQANDDGVLVLETPTGSSELVPGSKLGTLLHDEPTLQLVMLNACEAGRASESDPFAGVAQSLVRKGMPAVIAMQFEISDTAAIVLSHDFYGALSDGLPVDASLAEARKAIYAAGDGVEWGTPVLYLQNNSGQLFSIAETLPAPTVSTAPEIAPSPATEITRIAEPSPEPDAVTEPGLATAAASATPLADEHDLITEPTRSTAARPAPAKRFDPRILVGAVGIALLAGIVAFIGLRGGSDTNPPGEVLGTVEVSQPTSLAEPTEPPPTAAPEPTERPEPTATTEPTATIEAVAPQRILSNDIRVPRIVTPPVIDGRANEWDLDGYYYTDGVVYVDDSWDGLRDGGASFNFAHDAENLYVLAIIADDVHDQIFDGADVYRGDGINLNIASSASASSSGPNPGDIQLTMAMSDRGGAVLHWWTGDGRFFANPLGDLGRVEFAVEEADGGEFKGLGYRLEARIPKSTLPDDPALILASINDSDGEHSQTVVISHLLDDADFFESRNPVFQSPNRWGRLIFE